MDPAALVLVTNRAGFILSENQLYSLPLLSDSKKKILNSAE
ncbi:hypothetical protein Cycma_2269 [Cyclobacterium marinum DSM 745]|uniref:Uncharacterized protein n=1 Tax=Cyclobacterium marinum (strain ATCC 25205 / DSM 745 / LMG 13164 / NCIMB 1802) TaxID=880070 RepID=G0J517_CYCMS|nr:hypothetical protein Cycma_2269 [Cyclobacterium marinum DSM 745]